MFKPKFLAASIATALSAVAIAQDEVASPVNSAEEPEVITVTAQKRVERLIEVPIAMTNIRAEDMHQTGVQQLKDVAQYIPNFTMSDGTDFTARVSIRGVGSNSRNIGFDSRVGVYLDGVYLGQSPALNQALLDLERIEVLRGPQGTLFGKNTVAGAVNLISAKPHDEFAGSINTSFGNFGAKEVALLANIPITDNLFSKISVSKQQRDGFVKNLITGDDINELDDSSVRAQLFYISDDATFEARLSVDALTGDRLSYTGEPVTDSFGVTSPAIGLGEFETAMGTNPYEDRDVKGGSLTLDWELDNGFAVRSITAQRDSEIEYINDTDYSAIDFVTINYQDSYEQFSQEFQLISPDEGDLKYVFGLYYYDQAATTSRAVIGGEQGFLLGISAPVVTEGDVDTTSYAAFVNGSYQLSALWKLGFGLRYSTEEKDVDWAIDGTGAPLFGVATGTVVDSRKDVHLAPTVSINYEFNRNLYAYFRYGNAYKSGGYNLDFLTADALTQGTEFGKETVDNYELGLKGNLLGGDLSFNLAAFQTFYDDYQVNQFVELDNGGTSINIENAAEVKTQGIEAELTYNIDDHWTTFASLGLLDGEFESFPGGGANGADASGNDLPFVSDVTFSLGAQYHHYIESLEAQLLARLDYAYRSDFYDSVDNISSRDLADGTQVRFGEVDSYNTLNARLSLTSEEDTWEVALWAKNLTDESYLTRTGRDFMGTIRHFRGSPRTYGVELNYHF